MDPAVASALRDMMSRTSVEGTGRKHLAGFATLTSAGGVAVKTGTLTSRDGSGVFNTWMVGFYPARKPEFAFAAHIGTAGPGPIKAGHLTRFAINTWWKLKKARAGQS
jgi:cell division protein FtsI/penicillin-binding protein 2